MVTKYGNFPGVQLTFAGGGITAVAIGDEEKLVIFGEASYQNDSSFSPGDGNVDPLESSLDGSTEEPTQINARREANSSFGDGSELADGMREALANGANIDFMYGVAPERYNVVGEIKSSADGQLDNAPVWEEDVSDESNIEGLTVTDTGGGTVDNVRYTYEDASPLTAPSESETVVVNPLTGQFAADAAPDGDYEFSYKYLDWDSAVTASEVQNIVNADETGIYDILSDADSVSVTVKDEVESLRENYQLINVLSGAEPNSSEKITDNSGNYVRRDARYETSTFSQNSVDEDYYFKIAPARLNNSSSTILGGAGGLFAGNPLNDPIYNDQLNGYDDLEQSFTSTDADTMRNENVIPVTQAGTIRVKDNLSTSTAEDWERDFWRRRIADRVILIGKTIGDSILGNINDEQTRRTAARLIEGEMRELVNDRLLRPNASSESNWYVDVYEDSNNPNQVNIDIGFTPYGVVKRINETITIDTL
jgi:hypothetical protein